MTQFPLRDSFLEELKHHSGSDIAEVYRHTFHSMEAESLEYKLNQLKDVVKYDDWFYNFHKSMRQTDFFEDVYVHYTINTQTEKDLQRMEELKKILVMHKGKTWEGITNSERSKELGFEKELIEYQSLRRKASVVKTRSISGHMDMILWNLIHLDNTNFLKNFIERFFKQQ